MVISGPDCACAAGAGREVSGFAAPFGAAFAICAMAKLAQSIAIASVTIRVMPFVVMVFLSSFLRARNYLRIIASLFVLQGCANWTKRSPRFLRACGGLSADVNGQLGAARRKTATMLIGPRCDRERVVTGLGPGVVHDDIFLRRSPN